MFKQDGGGVMGLVFQIFCVILALVGFWSGDRATAHMYVAASFIIGAINTI